MIKTLPDKTVNSEYFFPQFYSDGLIYMRVKKHFLTFDNP